MRTTALGGAAIALAPSLSGCLRPQDINTDRSVRVAIVGAGLAGLHAAWVLRNNGIVADVFEASHRVGGRCLTAKNLLAPNTWTELGGEFIDSGHADMLRLCATFNLDLIDTDSLRSGTTDVYYFYGKQYTEADIAQQIAPFLNRIAADVGILPEDLRNLPISPASALDAMSMDAYFVSLGISGWLRSFLEVAFVTENGLELGEQSALNFVTSVATDVSDNTFRPFGVSDERYVVRGGVQQITNNLAAPLRGNIHTGHTLKKIEHSGSRYVVTFATELETQTIIADHVVLALPFTSLRKAHINVDLPEKKRRAITELRYGMNGKIFLGFSHAAWRAAGYSGSVLTDLPIQLAWENIHLSDANGGGLTAFYGGSAARVFGGMTKQQAAETIARHLPEVWPDIAPLTLGRTEQMHWPTQPHINASYSSYAPGQWTKFFGVEGASVGNLHFAGEHCSLMHKGFMNGAAETGRIAAEKVIAALG